MKTYVPELISKEKREAIDDFLDEVLKTPIMEKTMTFLSNYSKIFMKFHNFLIIERNVDNKLNKFFQ